MSRVILILSDLYPIAADPSEAQRKGLPRLPALERWLAQGEASALVPDWRHWVARELLAGRYASWSLASLAAGAVPGAVPGAAPARQPWLATPVHCVPGMDTVRMHPDGLLRLAPEEQRTLAVDFERVFQGSGWTLHATGQRELLLESDRPLHAHSSDPARWLGVDPSSGMPRGSDDGALRRLGAELEMWLYEHPVNRSRAAQGQLPVTGLWLWGGGESPAAIGAPPKTTARVPSLQIFGADLFLEGLARRSGIPSLPRPASSAGPLAAGAAAASSDTLLHHEIGFGLDSAALQRIDREWCAPLVEHWHDGPWESAWLLVGERAWALRRRRWYRWRVRARSRPWWESLLTC